MKNEDVFYTSKIIENNDCLEYYSEILRVAFRINKLSGEMMPVHVFSSTGSYRTIAEIDGKLYLFNGANGSFCIYDEKDNIETIREMPQNLHLDTELNFAGNYYQIGKELFFYWRDPVITKYSADSDKWNVYRNWKEKFPEGIHDIHSMLKDAYLSEDDLFILIGKYNSVLKMGTKNERIEIIQINPYEDDEMLLWMKHTKKTLWFISRSRLGVSVYTCNDENSFDLKKVCDIPVDTGELNPFSVVNASDDKIWLLPGAFDKAYEVNKSGEFKDISEHIPTCIMSELEALDEERYRLNYICYAEQEQDAWTINIHKGILVNINKMTGKITCKNIMLGNRREIIKDIINKEEVFIENSRAISLAELLETMIEA